MKIDINSIQHTQADLLEPVDGRAFLNALRDHYSPKAVNAVRDYLKQTQDHWNGNVGAFYQRVKNAQNGFARLSGEDQHYLIHLIQTYVA